MRQYGYRDDLRVRYEALLLEAESFGIDTTHMPSELVRRPGEHAEARSNGPGDRDGYGAHEEYDGFVEFRVPLEYRSEGRSFVQHDKHGAALTLLAFAGIRVPYAALFWLPELFSHPVPAMSRPLLPSLLSILLFWIFVGLLLGRLAFLATRRGPSVPASFSRRSVFGGHEAA